MTIAEAITQYEANVDWDTSATKARLALSALRVLRIKRATGMSGGGTSLSYAQIDAEIAAIEAYIAACDTTAHTSFTAARSRWA